MIGETPDPGILATNLGRVRIGELLQESLALADQIGLSVCAAHIAHALHLLDPDRPIAPPPGSDVR